MIMAIIITTIIIIITTYFSQIIIIVIITILTTTRPPLAPPRASGWELSMLSYTQDVSSRSTVCMSNLLGWLETRLAQIALDYLKIAYVLLCFRVMQAIVRERGIFLPPRFARLRGDRYDIT